MTLVSKMIQPGKHVVHMASCQKLERQGRYILYTKWNLNGRSLYANKIPQGFLMEQITKHMSIEREERIL